MSTDVFAHHFSDIQDPRQTAKVTYLLYDVLFLTVSAVIAGCQGWEDIEDFGVARLEWLKKYGSFENGIPVHDTIARLISRIEPAHFQSSFIGWMNAITNSTDGDVVAIDGKTLRGSYNRHDRQSTIHMVSAFATANGVVMGQLKTAEKSNEITAIPSLLALLEVKGCLVTIDAMGCQTKIAKTIIDKGADYLLAVKGNQETLFSALRHTLTPVIEGKVKGHVTIEQGHGRHEYREYHVLSATALEGDFTKWPSLNTIGVAIHYRKEKDAEATLAFRYYISSAELDSQRFAKAVRSHWGIENNLHWVLDASMKEDACQIYRGNASENLACCRHISLNMLRAEKTKKASIPRKRRLAAMQTDYLDAILQAGCNAVVNK